MVLECPGAGNVFAPICILLTSDGAAAVVRLRYMLYKVMKILKPKAVVHDYRFWFELED